MKNFAAFRWLVYLAALVLMVLEEGCRAVRVGFDSWCALVQQHEAGFKRLKQEAARQKLREAVADEAAEDARMREAVKALVRPSPGARRGQTVRVTKFSIPKVATE